MGEGNLLSLRWNNHLSNFKYTLSHLQQKNVYSDAMIACEGRFYPVHKFVLATCSDYFGSIFEKMPCKHPVIILKDVTPREVEFLLSYMYGGEVSVSQSDLPSLIRAAEMLHIRGLAAPDDPPGLHMQGTRMNQSKTSEKETEEKTAKRARLECLDSSERDESSIKTELDEDYNDNVDQESETSHQNEDTMIPVSQFGNADQLEPDDSKFYKDRETFPIPEIQLKQENEENLSPSGPTVSESDVQGQTSVIVHDTDSATWPSLLSSNISSVENDGLSTSLSSHHSSPPYSSQQSHATGDQLGENISSANSLSARNVQPSVSGILPQIICYCPMCDYTTHNRSWLNIHMRKHTGEKPYSCPYCPFRSAQKGNLNVHVRKIHSALPAPTKSVSVVNICSFDSAGQHPDDYGTECHSNIVRSKSQD